MPSPAPAARAGDAWFVQGAAWQSQERQLTERQSCCKGKRGIQQGRNTGRDAHLSDVAFSLRAQLQYSQPHATRWTGVAGGPGWQSCLCVAVLVSNPQNRHHNPPQHRSRTLFGSALLSVRAGRLATQPQHEAVRVLGMQHAAHLHSQPKREAGKR